MIGRRCHRLSLRGEIDLESLPRDVQFAPFCAKELGEASSIKFKRMNGTFRANMNRDCSTIDSRFVTCSLSLIRRTTYTIGTFTSGKSEYPARKYLTLEICIRIVVEIWWEFLLRLLGISLKFYILVIRNSGIKKMKGNWIIGKIVK